MRQAIDRIPSSAAYVRFFVPLALQTIAQSVTHPLVAVIAAQAPGGVANVAAMAQSTSISFLLQTFNMGLVTTGMIYARSASGFRVFSRLNLILVSVLGGVHLFFALPGPGSWLFDGLIGLPPQIAGPARLGFRAGIPLACLFMFRSRYYAILFANKASGRSSIAGLLRVALTVAAAPAFVAFSLVGPVWAYVCLTIPVAFETFLLARLASPYIRLLKDNGAPPPTLSKLFAFSFPLSAGSTLMVAANNILSAFIARAPDPAAMLFVYSLLMGVVNPLSSATSMMQRVVLAFAPASLRRFSSLRFAALAGAVCSVVPLVFLFPPLTRAYFVDLQNLSPTLIPALRATALMVVLHPLLVGLRSQIEGVASYLRRSRVILYGYGGNLAAIIVCGTAGLAFGLEGNAIGALGLFGANAAGIAINLAFLRREIAGFAVARLPHPVPASAGRRNSQTNLP